MSQSNAETVRSLYDAYLQRDRVAAAAVLHPEVEWRSIAGPILGVDVVHGREGVLAFLFERVLEGLPDFEARIEELTDLDDHQVLVAAHYVGHGGASGASVEMSTAVLYTLEEGRITSFEEFEGEAEAIAAAGKPVADRLHHRPDTA
jgi:ketosteroid isomerase-like protein